MALPNGAVSALAPSATISLRRLFMDLPRHAPIMPNRVNGNRLAGFKKVSYDRFGAKFKRNSDRPELAGMSRINLA